MNNTQIATKTEYQKQVDLQKKREYEFQPGSIRFLQSMLSNPDIASLKTLLTMFHHTTPLYIVKDKNGEIESVCLNTPDLNRRLEMSESLTYTQTSSQKLNRDNNSKEIFGLLEETIKNYKVKN